MDDEDEFDEYLASAMRDPGFARAYARASRITGGNVTCELAWFRIWGYGLWVCWGAGRDLYATRAEAHYWGRMRWKVLRPEKWPPADKAVRDSV